MPFDMTFREPPLVEPRATLGGSQRSTLSRAIGALSIQRALALLERTGPDNSKESGELIRLHASGLLEDIKHDWIAAPIMDLFDVIVEVAGFELTDTKSVGHKLRPLTERMVAHGETVGELIEFIDSFEPNVVHDLIRPAAVCSVLLAGMLVQWMTTETDEKSAEYGRAFDAEMKEVREHRMILCTLPYGDQIPELAAPSITYQEEIELLVGIQYPRDARRMVDVIAHLEAGGEDLCELASRQLRYLGPYQTEDPIWRRGFFEAALKVGRSAYPLLAHRGAYLTWRLVERALATDEGQTWSALGSLFSHESIWMIASQEDYMNALGRYRAGDQAAIVEAYGDLAEGTLRRYGSLVIALVRVASKEEVHSPLVLETVGAVETQLGLWEHEPLPHLILRFLERSLRNADAHANVLVAEDGGLQVRLRDGTAETVIANHVYGRTAGLRSLLDGVDVAMNHAFVLDKERTPRDLAHEPRPPMSAKVFELVVQHHAEQHTRGLVSDVRRDDKQLVMTYHGEVVQDELRRFAVSLTRLLEPSLPVIHIRDENKAEIATFFPARRHNPVGRNDPCPCGSGKKYKRCHGA